MSVGVSVVSAQYSHLDVTHSDCVELDGSSCEYPAKAAAGKLNID